MRVHFREGVGKVAKAGLAGKGRVRPEDFSTVSHSPGSFGQAAARESHFNSTVTRPSLPVNLNGGV
jgi:hypothetical protein